MSKNINSPIFIASLGEKMALDALPAYGPAAASIVVGGIYRHYKNLDYKVLSVGRHSETLEEMVVYQALYGEGNIWIRPVSMFEEEVVWQGQVCCRFSLCQN